MNEEILKIKSFMRQNKITYDVLSKKAGIPISTLNYIFTGRTSNPRMDTINSIKKALGMNTEGTWTADDVAQGITSTIRVSITPDEDEILYLYRRIGVQLGEAGQQAFKDMGETLLQIKKS